MKCKLFLVFFLFIVFNSSDIACAEEANSKLPHSWYAGLFGAGFSWEKSEVQFNNGRKVEMDNDFGYGVSLGYGFNDALSLQFDFTYFARLFPKESELLREIFGEDGGYFTLSLLLHHTLGRLVPYIGGGVGFMEVPSDKGTNIGFSPAIQGGFLLFVSQPVAISTDLKHLWGILNNAEDNTIGAWTYSLGIQVTFK